MAANKGHSAAEYWAAYQRLGSARAVAREFGVRNSTVDQAIRPFKTDPAIQRSMGAVGTNMVPTMAWAKSTAGDDGIAYSVLLRPAPVEDDFLDRVREAFDGMAEAPQIDTPTHCDADLLTIYPIADAHVGLMAWGKEVGEAYDTNTAAQRIRDWIGRCIASSPASETAIILDVGDLTHADDQTNQTPASKHVLDVDTRHFRTLEVTISALCGAVYAALHKHAKVIVRVLPGNHDSTAYMAVLFAMAEHFRHEPRVEVQKQPGEFFVYQFGSCLLAAHHGHKAKPERMVLFLADEYGEMWGRTKHRFLWTGHLHNHRSADIGGCQWEQLRALTSRDAYAVSNAYVARSQLQAITLHRTEGEVQRVKVAS